MAWATRNLLELLLRYYYIRHSDEHLQKHLVEQLRDEIDIYESLKTLADMPGDDQWCDDQIQKVNSLAAAQGHTIPKKPQPVSEIAKAVGLEDEYRAVYKLYSKWVHPSSWRLCSGGFQPGFVSNLSRMYFVGKSKGYALTFLDLVAEDAAAAVDVSQGAQLGPYDQPLAELDEIDELPDTSLDPESKNTMRQLRDEMRELGIEPRKDPNRWKRRRVL